MGSYIQIKLPKNNKIVKEHLNKYSKKDEELTEIIKWVVNVAYDKIILEASIKNINKDTILIIELSNEFKEGYEEYLNFVRIIIKFIYKNDGLFLCKYHIYNTDLNYYYWSNE